MVRFGFWFRKIALHGDSATVVPFEKRSVFHVCFNINRILFACYSCVAQHLGNYGVFGIEKTPSLCIFPFLMFFYFEKLSRRGIWSGWDFGFEKSPYMGTQPPWSLLKKEVSSTFASISIVFFLPAIVV